jgi:hypothetical protein
MNRSLELFPDTDLGDRREPGGGCARPIGRRPNGQARRPRVIRARRPSTAALLAEVRSLLHHELGNVGLSLRRIERGGRMQLEFQEVTNDALERVLLRLVRLERAAGVVEQPAAPRTDRRRPLDG